MNLKELAVHYGTDKANPNKYIDYYEKHFLPCRDLPISLLEIGVGEGKSLTMWANWFAHPQREIHSIDINANCLQYASTINGIYIHIGDQKDLCFLKRKFEHERFDIIIDDGGHTMSEQKESFNHLFRFCLKKGGWYVIEDLHTSSNLIYKEHKDSPVTTIDMLSKHVYSVNMTYSDRYGYGDRRATVKYNEENGFVTPYMDRYIDEMHFYKGVCFIKKGE